jgi:hypothetical protein
MTLPEVFAVLRKIDPQIDKLVKDLHHGLGRVPHQLGIVDPASFA